MLTSLLKVILNLWRFPGKGVLLSGLVDKAILEGTSRIAVELL